MHVEREARIFENAEAFDRAAGQRFPVPGELSFKRITRGGRDEGFEVDLM
ncbi:hypothetical protein KEK_00745 [Mycolicibacterium thermoresistibile ATCC 19527]|uniref:Uncharacterized protein n=1 Tax=Mycolicibacterium thermoresistibile (strain ATCC 19527 / DSM 44167 / CIP 105390 / JCM 6362 / NCTC 10409 / 316) TaxID=1078020 RepID=G7CB07_MYCT3|nr:hypothetical protein KEK_00745 [Mycolicibacterium thermoresistibile ATCC 19527]